MKRSVRLLKALGDETRFKIVLFLLNGRRSVSEITKQVKKAQPTISLHLKLLQLYGIVESHREGKFTVYSIKDGRIKKIVGILKHG